MSSKSFSCYPIISALLKAEEFANLGQIWTHCEGESQPNQEKFIEFIKLLRCEIQNIDEIEAMASSLAEEINRFLKERGFRIPVDDLVEGAIGIVCILDFKFIILWGQT